MNHLIDNKDLPSNSAQLRSGFNSDSKPLQQNDAFLVEKHNALVRHLIELGVLPEPTDKPA